MQDEGGVPTATAPVRTFDDWRETARQLLRQGVPPHAVQWQDGGRNADPHRDLFAPSPADSAPEPARLGSPQGPQGPQNETHDSHDTHDTHALQEAAAANNAPAGASIRVSRELMALLETAACHRSEDRWAFLYQVMWRWQRGEHEVISPADADGSRLNAMVKAVRREEHDMHAYVRFRERTGVNRDGAQGRTGADDGPRFVAWYEPSHDVLPRVAEHFARRMGQVSWMITTPDACVVSDGASVRITGPILRGPEEVDDAGEALWLTYYRSIFNPSRLNAQLMQSHIPSRFWKNLPEGRVVPGMVADAATGARRVGQAEAVGRRAGHAIVMAPRDAQPQRQESTALDQCRRCDLWRHATQAVHGRGPATASIMLVGEQPGDQEDLSGEPFIGPAGQLLDQVMQQAQVSRTQVYLTNAVKHFKWEPRGKRRLHKTADQREIMACRHWLEEEIERVDPKAIVALGATALKSLMRTAAVRMRDVIGRPFEHDGRWIVVVYHPAYVLRLQDEAARQQALESMVEGLRAAAELAGKVAAKRAD